jgi:hypothetical protein
MAPGAVPYRLPAAPPPPADDDLADILAREVPWVRAGARGYARPRRTRTPPGTIRSSSKLECGAA